MNLRVWVANIPGSNQFGTTGEGIVVMFTSSCSLKRPWPNPPSASWTDVARSQNLVCGLRSVGLRTHISCVSDVSDRKQKEEISWIPSLLATDNDFPLWATLRSADALTKTLILPSVFALLQITRWKDHDSLFCLPSLLSRAAQASVSLILTQQSSNLKTWLVNILKMFKGKCVCETSLPIFF